MADLKEEDIIRLVREDEWMMGILATVKKLALPDWWVCAGFVRSKIWDIRHGYEERTPLPDVDVIYYDSSQVGEELEKEWEKRLRSIQPAVPWSVKNQVRMHRVNGISSYSSSADAISKFPETASALGLNLSDDNRILLCAPWGVADAVNGIVRPTPFFRETPERLAVYRSRLIQKNWSRQWGQITVERD
ncbi:nucleotidyltransferase family protein [Paenibacillus nasutitermitis]|uniref:Nucleotidyltransferase family protein n=1 Tax=Paenibacillus nasutitermitis TaxID=1652958 RepID=A0A916ZF86_9BACL|nr:nucleotidyltransferase family protein [Paenibacillus nasutitermitis]GGD93353.1 hypothetical protein GCM10010911_59930 [Paenibacillus nasutitermitis]